MVTIVAATRKGLFFLDQAEIVQSAFLGDPVSMFHYDSHSGIMYAALDHGHFGVKLHRSQDNGKSWLECACPTFPSKPETAEAEGDKNPWALSMIWSFASGHGKSAGQIWCGTIPGGLFKSTDNGDSWQLIESLWNMPERKEWFGGGKDQPGIHSICVDPRNDQHVYVGVSCAGVWFSDDGGLSWAARASGMRAEYMPPEKAFDVNVQDPHCVVQCRSQPDIFWCQHHNGIFKSVNAGVDWQEITDVSPSVFGFACAVDPHDGNRAWFVPAIKDEKRIPVDGKLVVTSTLDGGKTFGVSSAGLPQTPAYDLVYRHGLAIDSTGKCLVFGSTTGSLWSSQNSGESWSLLSAHLPPIYMVTFIPSRK